MRIPGLAGAVLLWVAAALWVATASALDTCKALIRPTDGTIVVEAQNVTGTLVWGFSARTATNAFSNAETCVAGSPLVATNCTLGTGAVANTPPALCTLYLKDGAGTCSAFIRRCTPSKQPRFIDNGDGTMTDTTTGLMWEKKTTDGSVHDVNKDYKWSTGTNNPDGTVFTDFLAKLNDVAGGGLHCFAGYCDWRLPNEEGLNTPGGPKELETILDTTQGSCGGGGGPCIYPALGPSQSGFYWSATTVAGDPPISAWVLAFSTGRTDDTNAKTNPEFVRAVRGGL